jgi:hypothetical protein
VDAHPARPSTVVFVVRIWLEDPARPGAGPVWRATITDVVGQRQRTIDRLDQLVEFFSERLAGLGVRPDGLGR